MPFIIGGAIAAGVGLLGAGGAAAGGIGQNKTSVTNFGDTTQYNPNAFNYGGNPNGAAENAGLYQSTALNAMNRQAPQANFSGAQPDYQYAARHASVAAGDRDAAANVAGLMYNRAAGNVPSIAGMQARADQSALARQAQEQTRQAMAGQASLAASARGPAGLALAQQNMANNVANANGAIGMNTANSYQNISNQAQVNAAQERMQAEQAASGAFSNLYGLDANARDAEIALQQFGANLGTQQQEYNTGLQLQNRAENDQTGLGFANLANNVQVAQLNAQGNGQGMLSNSFDVGQGQRIGVNAANAANQWKPIEMGLGAVTGGMGFAGQGMGGGGGGGYGPGYSSMGASYAPGGEATLGQGSYLSDDRAKLIKAYQAGQHDGIRALADDQSYGADMHTLKGVGQMFMPGMPAAGLANLARGAVGNAQSMGTASRAQGMPFGETPPQYVQQGAPQGLVPRTGRVIGASVPEEPLPPGVAMSPHPLPAPPSPEQQVARIEQDNAASDEAAVYDQWQGLAPERKAWMDAEQRRMARTDRTTAQLGRGLAPISFEYKPGMGPPGDRLGIRAQGALETPLTAPMIVQRPDGLLAIDHGHGLGTALAGVGHLAQKVAAHDEELGKRRRQ